MEEVTIKPLDEEEPNVRVMRIYELTVRFVVPDYGDPCDEHKHFPMATPLDYVTLDDEAVLLSYEEKEVVLP